MSWIRPLVVALSLSPLALAAQDAPSDSLFLKAWSEPAACTRATCALRVTWTADGPWLVRGEPGSRVGRAEWARSGVWDGVFADDHEPAFRALEVAVASNAEAVALVRAAASAARTRATAEAVGLVSLGGAGLLNVASTGSTGQTVAAGLAVMALGSLVPDIGSEVRMRRRVAEAIRRYNAGLPETALGSAAPGGTAAMANGGSQP